MNYRRATVLAQESASTPATKTVDITVKDPISRLIVKFNYLNDGHAATAHPAKIIKTLELVDGSDVLTSLSGMQAEVLNFCDTGQRRGHELEYRNDCWGEIVLALNFGRFLYDPILALDPAKFRNPQLKVSHDLALGGSAPDDATLEVFADIFDEKDVSPTGFLSAKQWYSYTLQAGAYHHVDMPTDHILRRLLILSLAADRKYDDQFDEFKLSEDNDKRIPIQISAADLLQIAGARYGQFFEDLAACSYGIDTYNWYITPSGNGNFQISPIGDAEVYTANQRKGGYQDVSNSAVCVWRALVSGFEPHGGVPIDFGNPADLDDWYDVTKVGSLVLRI